MAIKPTSNEAAMALAIHSLGAIHKSPQHAVLLAQIAAVWSEIEHRLVLAYAGIMQTPYPVAKHALHNTTNVNSRVKIVRSACAEYPPSEAFKSELSGVLDQVGKLASRRAKFIHGRWCYRGDGTMFLIDPASPSDTQAAMRKVTVTEMRKLVDEMIEAGSKLDRLVNQTRPIPPLPDEVARRKYAKSTDQKPEEV